ncbi:hypothetical protein ACS3UN_01840 [Oscillospiraceae bacterium LTW-04]|nr:hypothetical protein RBH76_08620 [Oscillospiraceae bacterium MB24-C1]
MEKLLLRYLLFGLGLLIMLTFVNFYITYKTKRPSKWLVRTNYLLGIVMVLLNAARMFNDSYTMASANIIVLASIIIAWVRTEKGDGKAEE